MQAAAQRTNENAVAEAGDAFGTTVGTESIGLYSSSSARGFNPSQAGNLRINGLYFDQAGSPNNRLIRGNTVHVGISAQGYPFPAPTGVVDFDLRVPGSKFVTSVLAGHGAVFSYPRSFVEIDTQIPVVKDVLSVGGGFAYQQNQAHQNAVGDDNYMASAIIRWNPSDAISITPFWSGTKGGATSGDRPRVFIGDSDPPTYRQAELGSPQWLYYGYVQQNYGGVANMDLPDRWKLAAGVFRSDNTSPKTYTAFLLNTNSLGQGDYAIEGLPSRYVRSTSGEVRLSKIYTGPVRRHSLSFNVRARDRRSTFGGGDLRRFGRATIGAIPILPQPVFRYGVPTASHAKQIIGGAAYEGVWRGVGQLSLGLQKTKYQRTVIASGGVPVTGRDSPWLYNAGTAIYVLPELALYAGYTRGLEELGTAPGNALNRDEGVPAALTRQIDAGVRYQIRPNLQLVVGGFMIDKPYYGLDPNSIFRELGDIRHTGLELSLTGTLTDEVTVVAGAVALRPRITGISAAGVATRLIAVGPTPRLLRANFQYRPGRVSGLALDLKVESISSSYLNVANTRRLPGTVTVDAGVRYTTKLSGIPVRFRLQGNNLTSAFYITPQSSGQITASEPRRVEFTIAADF